MTADPAHTLRTEELACVRNDMVLFQGLELRISSGEMVHIQGANGSGKTSLLRILCGLARPEEGKVLWDDRDITELNGDYVTEIRYVGHQNAIKSELTPAENLAFSCALSRTNGGISPDQALKEFGLYGYEDTPVSKLSSGQKRRVALSQLLLTGAHLWILDEPYTSVDDEGRRFVAAVLAKHLQNGGMLILVSHEPVRIPDVEVKQVVLGRGR